MFPRIRRSPGIPCLLAWIVSTVPAAGQGDNAATASHPAYVMADGSVQIVASSTLAGAVRALNALFLASHPGVRFTVRVGDNYSAMAALTFDRSAFAPMGCEYTRIGLGDNLKIAAEPLGFRVAHASVTPGPAVPSLGVIVNRANPLAKLSLAQLTRIFAVAGPAGDITTWSQAGVSGTLADREIHPAGPLATDYTDSDDPQAGEFLSLIEFGGLNMNHRYIPLPHYADVVARIDEDPSAIGITALNIPLGDAKVVALSGDTGPALYPSAVNIASGRYPLDRFVYIYLHREKGHAPDPFALEYMRAVLSEAGQRALASEAAGYIPLSAGELATERAKLDR